MTPVRCAIYTRKSSEEGLEQGFNSLDAQREACAAYILSQASEGWIAIGERYDDGGLSGGTLERPALQRLLADVAARRIDIIVVYKVDRLTRSLLDFAKLVEALDTAGVSFVSITQSFNTTTSMGPLTLNMLLSFAQFEREVTAERIRDKIAASKARGMWMGGVPPLGYRPNGRSLAIVADHAAVTRHIFARYLALGNVRLLGDELARAGIHAPARQTAKGKPIGGRAFSRGQLYLMLKCVTYAGRIAHHGTIYPGQHPAIIDLASFDAVQALLAANTQGTRTRARAAQPSLLAGRIVDAAGMPLIAVHASKPARGGAAQQRYRYYVSRARHHGEAQTGLRIPAHEIETLVAGRVAYAFDDPIQLMSDAMLDIPVSHIAELDQRCRDIAAKLRQRHHQTLTALVTQVRVKDDAVVIDCDAAAIAAAAGCALTDRAAAILTLTHAVRVTRGGRIVRLVSGNLPAPAPDRSIVRLLVQARRWWGELRRGEMDVTQLATRDGVSACYLTRVLRLAFLSPDLVQLLLAGKQPTGIDAAALLATGAIDACWQRQRDRLLPAG